MKQESRRASSTPGVVAIHDVYLEHGRPHFVMALVSGTTLAAALEEVSPDGRRSLVRHALEAAEVVAHAHRSGILHRDLSTSNVLIASDGAARVVDWGLAAETADAPSGRVGTPGFAAPEVLRGEPSTARSDVYGLGAITHAAALGQAPAGGGLDPSLASALDPELAAIPACALSPDPEGRYPDGAAFAADLRRWLDGRPVLARELSPAAQLLRLLRHYRGRVLLVAAVLLVVTGTLAFGFWRTAHEAARAHAAEREALATVATLQRVDAAQAFVDGDLDRARRSVISSLATLWTPEAAGVWMQVSRALRPGRVLSRQLAPCPRWILTPLGEPLICSRGGTRIEAWQGNDVLWRKDLEHEEIRIVGAEVLVLTRERRLRAFGLTSGDALWDDDRQGVFATAFDDDVRFTLDALGVFSPTRQPERFCAQGMTQMRSSGDDRFVICHGGAVLRIRGGGDAEVVHPEGRDVPTVLVHAGGRLWLATRTGLVFPVDGRTPRLDLGAAVDALEPLAGGRLALARSSSGRVRVFDAVRGTWAASFPDDTLDARPAPSGLWLLRTGSVLEQWVPEPQPIWRYTSHDGFASLVFSADGSILYATDGAGRVHAFSPEEGRIFDPLRVSTAVARQVRLSPGDGRPRVLTVDPVGLIRVEPRDGALVATVDGSHAGMGAGFGYLAGGRSFAFDYVGNLALDGERVDRVWEVGARFIRRSASSPDLAQAYLIGVDGEVFAWDGAGPPERLSWPLTRYVAVSDEGLLARVGVDGAVEVRAHDGTQRAAWHAGDAPVTAVAWRRGAPMLAVGHADGAIQVFDADGALEAVLRHHSGRIAELASSPDGALLAAASWDATVSVSSFTALDGRDPATANP